MTRRLRTSTGRQSSGRRRRARLSTTTSSLRARVAAAFRAIAKGVTVVVVTRCLTGAVAPTYGGPGGGHTLESIGVIAGSDLNASKARVALAVAMGVDPTVNAVRAWFEELG